MYIIFVSHDIYVFSIVTTGRDHLLFLPRKKSKCWAQNTQSTSSSKATPDRTSNSFTNSDRSRYYNPWGFCWIYFRECLDGTCKKYADWRIHIYGEEKQICNKMTIRDVSVKMIYSGTELKICFGIIFVFIEMSICVVEKCFIFILLDFCFFQYLCRSLMLNLNEYICD